jgi:DNA-binding NarL/FixJ family response regulator
MAGRVCDNLPLVDVANTSALTIAILSREISRRERLVDAFGRLGHDVVGEAAQAADLGDGEPRLIVLAFEGARAAMSAEIQAMRERLPEAWVLLVLPKGSPLDPRVTALGAHAILNEGELDATLGIALEALGAGLAVLPGELSAMAPVPVLSSREKQVLSMLVMGLTNIEIATRLYVTESTVKSHVSSAFRKLGVRSRKDAVARILDPENGLGLGILAISGGGDR